MSSIEILDSNLHREISIDFKAARCGPRRELIPVVISEFHSLMFHYPIVFVKDQDTGEFTCSILLGVSAEANLLDQRDLVSDEGLPLNIRRLPLVAVAAPEGEGQPLIGINRTSPGVNPGNGTGDYIFQGKSERFESAVAALVELYNGFEQTRNYVKKVLELDLISKLQAEIRYTDKPSLTLDGLYGIDPKKIALISESNSKSKDEFLAIASYVYAQHFSLYNMKKLATLIS
jgi:hypothetical protein